ncbi:MAG: hypothetical protein ACK4Y6_11050 [Bacteroidota bacterium]
MNTKRLRFKHNTKGVLAYLDNKRFIFSGLTVLKEGVSLNEQEFESYLSIWNTFNSEVRGKPFHPTHNYKIIEYNIDEVKPYTGKAFKYIQYENYEKFITKGKWLLGNIEHYATIENESLRDEYEGFTHMNLFINNHQTSFLVQTNFNYLIFCCSHAENSNQLKQQFGECIFEITDINAFAKRIVKTISAKRYYIRKVVYSSPKVYSYPENIINPDIKIGSDILNESFIDLARQHSLYPTLFIKPESFKHESEIRIVFEMQKDYFKPFTFENLKLLNYISKK